MVKLRSTKTSLGSQACELAAVDLMVDALVQDLEQVVGAQGLDVGLKIEKIEKKC
jgi:hypothetical protein